MAYFREMLDVDFHERVAREHVDGGMPLVELRRNHDVPLAAVKAWVALYTAGGRPALAAAADALAAAQRKAATPATLRKLREVLAAPVSDGRSREARRAAVIAVGARRFGELADAVEELVARGEEVIEGLLTLGDLGELERIERVAPGLDAGHGPWLEGARERAAARRR